MFQALAFYLFAAVLTGSALMVISARNPVHSVLFLILGFFNAAGLFILLGAEFVGLILVIVYVGAVAVLFLFVVMMLDVSFADLRRGAMRYAPLGVLTGGVLLAELFVLYRAWGEGSFVAANRDVPVVLADDGLDAVGNTRALGGVLYTDYVYAFQAAGLVLLVAMIGAIVLTHRRRPGTRRQKIAEQTARRPADAMEVQKVESGTGVNV